MSRIFCLAVCCFLLLSSCSKQGSNTNHVHSVTCQSFDDPLFIEWFPYTNAQKIIFKNDSGNTDTIIIQSVNISGNYTKTSTTFTADSCSATAIIYSTQRVDSNYLKLYIDDYTNAIGQDSVSFTMYGFSFTCGPASDTGLNLQNLNPQIYSSTYNNYSFHGKTYNKVQVITSTDTIVANTHIPWIYRVYISQNTGVIGYETFPQKQTWVLQ